MSEVKLVIDGEEVKLVHAGKSQKGTYEKFKEPEGYANGEGSSPIIVTVYLKPGWKPSKGGTLNFSPVGR